MHKSVHAGQQVDKGAVGFDSHNLPGVDFAYFDLFCQGFNFAASLFGRETVLPRDKDRAVVVDIDLDFVSFLQCTNGLAARADNLADLLRVHVDGEDAGRVGAEFLTGFGKNLQHLFHDVHAPLPGLLQRDTQDFKVQSFDFEIHLQSGDAVSAASDFEIHVAEVILDALDIGQYHVFPGILILNQAHRNAGNGRINGDTGVHQRQSAATDGAHAGGAVAADSLAHQAQGVGELVGNYRLQGPFRQSAVADFAAFWPPHGVGFAGRIGREIIVMDIALIIFRLQGIDALGIARRAQRRDGQDVGFAAHEQPAAMDAG